MELLSKPFSWFHSCNLTNYTKRKKGWEEDSDISITTIEIELEQFKKCPKLEFRIGRDCRGNLILPLYFKKEETDLKLQ